jgi:tRNA pseudouridine38-40 synthase
MPTYRLELEYDGTHFAGWQVQSHGRTVQGVLLERLRELVGQQDVDLQGAGRTDSGVHALGQVASLRTRRPVSPARLARELDRALPADLSIRSVREAVRGFHARHDASGRAYRYQLALRRSAFGKRTTWWLGERLDLEAMAAAGRSFVGRHDFRAFARRAAEAESTLVEMEGVTVAEGGDVAILRLIASHFLWNQVRRMVGALVEVGRGAAAPGDVPGWLDGSRRAPALAAPAAGLFLEAVRYPGEPFALPPLLPVGVPPPRDAGMTW